jgi:hypothetical protein
MPLIPDEIPQQHFELIRDRIGLILYQEIENQWSEFGDEDLEAPMPNEQISTTPTSLQVYIDRIIPIDESECPVVNVSFSGAPYENNNPLRSEGVNTFYIDVYTKAKGEDDDDADRLANIKLQKILGKIAFILRHSYYKTLGFTPGFIGNTKVASIQIADTRDPSFNANGCVMGRVTFEVRATEEVTPVEVRDMTGFYTTVKLFLTNKGFLYIDTY